MQFLWLLILFKAKYFGMSKAIKEIKLKTTTTNAVKTEEDKTAHGVSIWNKNTTFVIFIKFNDKKRIRKFSSFWCFASYIARKLLFKMKKIDKIIENLCLDLLISVAIFSFASFSWQIKKHILFWVIFFSSHCHTRADTQTHLYTYALDTRTQ